MAFIRRRISPSRRKTPSYQIIETYREDGKVKQRVLANLGSKPTPELALREFQREADVIRARIRKYETAVAVKSPGRNGVGSLDKWRKAYARRLDSVQRIERFLAAKGAERPEKATSNEVSFLEWMMDRNVNGWV